MKPKEKGFTIHCTAPDGFCSGAEADLWCVLERNTCPYLVIGISKNHSEYG